MGQYSDPFTNADGTALATHDANWTVSNGSIEINSNAARCPTASGTAIARYSGGTFTSDQSSKGIISFNGGSGYVGFTVRDSGADRCYVQVAASGTWLIRQTNAGTLTSGSSTFADLDEIEFRVVGNVYTAWRNGSQFATISDATLSGGKPGIFFDNAAANFDSILSWAGGDYPAVTNPVLSAATSTPASTSATVGATTDQASGTLYVVVDSAANLSGVTATQIKTGQKASGSAALSSGNSSVSDTSPDVAITGLAVETLYAYAAVQNNTNGDSNVVTGTFTTTNGLDQKHFRWRNDDGSETTATWAAAEDADISVAALTAKRLRVQVAATGDPSAKSFKLQYRKVGDGTWRDI